MFKNTLTLGLFLLLAVAPLATADEGAQCFTAMKFQIPTDPDSLIYSAVEYLETQDDFEEAMIQAVQRWIDEHIPQFEPATGGITFADHGTHTTATIKWPGGEATIIIYGPYLPLPEDTPRYIAAGQMVVFKNLR